MQPLQVLHVIPSVSPTLGGPTQVVLNLVKALGDRGIAAEIVTTNDNGDDVLDVPLYQRSLYEQVPVWFLPRFSPPLKEFIFSPALTGWLWQNLRRYQVLDNHYLFSYAPTCAGAIARYYHIPYTVRTMGQLSPWALAQSRLKKRVYTRLIERQNLNRAAAIHCTSPEEAADVRRFGITTPTLTLPLGVAPAQPLPQARLALRQRYALPSDAPVVLFLSRLHYKKRPDLLLKAVHQLTDYPDLQVILAGTGEEYYVEQLTLLAQSLQLGDRVKWVGFVTGQEKDLLLQGADLFVLPSFSENFGIAIAEAMAAGLPVVITPGVQIATQIADAQAGLVIEGTVRTIAQGIDHLLRAPALRQEMGRNGQRLVRDRYSWQAIATDLALAYQAIVQRSPLPPPFRGCRLDPCATPLPSVVPAQSPPLE